MSRSDELRSGVTPLGSSFAWRIRDLERLFERAVFKELAEHGITYGQWRCLRVLWEEDGVSQKELGNRLDMTSASAVFSVNMLERDGLAKRITDAGDKRRVTIRLTKRGRGLGTTLLPALRELNHRIVANFPNTDIIALDALLERLKHGLEAELRHQQIAIA
jgi:DNA-binding MarR family transcriptional regulator